MLGRAAEGLQLPRLRCILEAGRPLGLAAGPGQVDARTDPAQPIAYCPPGAELCPKLYYTVLYYTILYYTTLYSTILFYNIHYHAILYHDIVYSTIL